MPAPQFEWAAAAPTAGWVLDVLKDGRVVEAIDVGGRP
jgi:hypothetical protein